MAKNELEGKVVSKRGGYRPGAGRPKGTKNQPTIEKERLREIVRQKVARHLDALLEAQVSLALGRKYLVVRDKRTGKFVRVAEAMARDKLANGEELVEVWEADPSTSAFTNLMNRTLDKPKEQDIEVKVSGSVAVVARLQAARKRLAAATAPTERQPARAMPVATVEPTPAVAPEPTSTPAGRDATSADA